MQVAMLGDRGETKFQRDRPHVLSSQCRERSQHRSQ